MKRLLGLLRQRLRTAAGAISIGIAALLFASSADAQCGSAYIVAPPTGTVVTAPGTFNIDVAVEASVMDPDLGECTFGGTVTGIRLYQNGVQTSHQATQSGGNFRFSLSGVPAGTYSYYVIAAFRGNPFYLQGSAASQTISVRSNGLPSISLTAPANGAVINGPSGAIYMSATASDDAGINRVEFYANGSLIHTDTAAPYEYNWSGVGAGTYSISARAVDSDGAATTSAAAAARVNAPPSVNLTAPSNGTTGQALANFTLSANASDADGSITQVEFLVNGAVVNSDTAAPYSYTWSNVGAGSYTITARATDNNGQQTTSSAATVTVTNPAPTVSLTGPANGTVLSGPTNSIAISANASDANGSINRVEFYSGTTLLATDTTAPYSYTWSGVSAGTYSITAKAFDNEGAVTTSSAASVRINALPTVSLTSPANGASAQAPASFTLSANAADADGGITQVEFLVNDAVVATDTTAPFSVNWSSANGGTHTIKARAADNNGQQTTSAAVTVTVNNVAPTVALTAPANGTVLSGPTNSIAISANASDANGSINRVEFYSGATLLATDATAPYEYTWSGVGAGTYSLTAKAFDNEGASTTSAAATIRINALPSVSVTAPANGASAQAPATFNLSANASDSDGTITQVEFLVNGTVVATDTAAPYSYTWSNAPAGTHTITARATDNNGQVTTSAAVNVTAINTAPSVQLTKPASGILLAAPASATLSATASDVDGTITKVEFFSGSTLVGQGTYGSGSYSYTWSGLSPGTYTVYARATDNSGSTTDTAPIVINVAGPTAIVPSDISGPVAGTLPGSVAVDPSGAANYRIPLALPPGTAGMVPTLALAYSSRGGDGMIGYGWSLEGLSSITRCGKTKATDALASGVKTRVNLDGNDQYCLDGQRLILVGGTLGTNAEFRTEIDTFSKVQSFGSDSARGPDRWEVRTKDGRILTYGNTADSTFEAQGRTPTVVLSWMLGKVQDRRGNYYTVAYEKVAATGEIYPSLIRHTGNGSALTPYHAIRFDYNVNPLSPGEAERADLQEGYVAGSKVSVRRRLDRIRVLMDTATDGGGGVTAREYRLQYTRNPTNRRYLVQSIQECDGTGTCLPATEFGYQQRTSADHHFNAPGSGNWGGPNLEMPANYRTGTSTFADARDWVETRAVFGDFNGDGKQDVAYGNDSGTWSICPSTGSSFVCSGWAAPGRSENALVGDFNGDGLADLAMPPAVFGGTGGWTVCLSTGTAFSCAVWQGYVNGYVYGGAYQLADIDGDGRDDIIVVDNQACRSTGTGFSCAAFANATKAFTTTSSDGATEPTYLYARQGDYVGDGRSHHLYYFGNDPYIGPTTIEFCVTTESGIGCPTQLASPIPERVIGSPSKSSAVSHFSYDGVDAYADAVLVHEGPLTGGETCQTVGGFVFCTPNRGPAQAQICRSTGNGVDCARLPTAANSSDYNFTAIGDVDGDGRPDGIKGGEGVSSVVRVCQLLLTKPSCADYSIPAAAVNAVTIRVADFNGDGRLDIAQHFRTTDDWTVRLAAGPTPDLLISVTNGVGHQTQIAYANLQDANVYANDAAPAYPLRSVQDGTMVVAQVQTSNGIGGWLSTSYKYGGAQTDLSGRGALGFRWFEATDGTTGVVTRTEVSQTFPHIGMPTLISATRINTSAQNVEIKRVENVPASMVTANAATTPKVWFPYFGRAVETERELNDNSIVATTTTDPVSYDAYGNLMQSVVSVAAGGETHQTTTETQYSNNASTWLIGLPTRITVTRTAPGAASVTRVRALVHDPTYGDLLTETIEPDDPTNQFKSTVTLDREPTTGIVRKRTLSWTDGSPKSRVLEEITQFDGRWRYPTTVKNALGHTETRAYNQRFGAVTSLTGPNGITTTWTYDGFGRRIREDRADGTSTTTSVTQCTQACGHAKAVTAVRVWKGSDQISVPVVVHSDALGRNIRRQSWSFDGTETVTEREHDATGRVYRIARTRFLSESPVWKTFGYDELGRVASITGPDGTESIQYLGLTTVYTNAKGQIRTDVRNGLGKLRTTTDHYNQSTTYAYEPFGNLRLTVDPKGNRIVVGYDKLGRKTQLIDPDLGTWNYVVNAIGELKSQTDAKNQTTTFTYDDLGRMTRRLAPDQDANWVYDTAPQGKGKLAEAYTLIGAGPSKDYRRVHTYDSLGRPARSTITIAGDHDYVTEQSYDDNGRLGAVTYQRNAIGGSGGASLTVTQAYTSTGYLGQVRLDDTLLWTVEQQDAQERVRRYANGNGVVTRRDFHAGTGRLTNLVAGPRSGGGEPDATVQNDGYVYDELGNVLNRTHLKPDGTLLSETFTYDALNRLRTAQIAGQSAYSFDFDEIGNLTSKTGVGSYSYNPSGAGSVRPHAVASITGSVAGITHPSFAYDNNGNLTAGLGRTATWMSFNAPASINKTTNAGPGAAGSGTVTDTFAYGPEQQRVRQTVTVSGGPNAGTTTILYAGAMEKETRSAEGVTVVKTFVGHGIVVFDRYGGTAANISAAPPTRQIRYLHQDRLGSTVAVTDEAGSVVERLAYDVWGKRRNGDGSENHAAQSVEHRHGFTAHEHLDSLGLVHMNGRVYDPTVARFISADPTVPDAGDTQNYNRYSYVLNNPGVYTDPSGFAQVRQAELPGNLNGGPGGGLFDEYGSGREFERLYLDGIPNVGCEFDIGAGCGDPTWPFPWPRNPLDCRTVQCRAMLDGGGNAPDPSKFSDVSHVAPDGSWVLFPVVIQPREQDVSRGLSFSSVLDANWRSLRDPVIGLSNFLTGGNDVLMQQAWRDGRYGYATVFFALGLGTGVANVATGGQGSRIQTLVSAIPRAARGAGTPLWSATKNKSAVENALGHWNRHRAEFPELANSKQYVEAAHSLATNPPATALTKTRGADTLIYDQATNTFLVKGADGAPRTMFRPIDGINYWNRQ